MATATTMLYTVGQLSRGMGTPEAFAFVDLVHPDCPTKCFRGSPRLHEREITRATPAPEMTAFLLAEYGASYASAYEGGAFRVCVVTPAPTPTESPRADFSPVADVSTKSVVVALAGFVQQIAVGIMGMGAPSAPVSSAVASAALDVADARRFWPTNFQLCSCGHLCPPKAMVCDKCGAALNPDEHHSGWC
jgi:hypothetical protein